MIKIVKNSNKHLSLDKFTSSIPILSCSTDAKNITQYYFIDPLKLFNFLSKEKDLNLYSIKKSFDYNPFEKLDLFNIDKKFFTETSYRCPFNNIKHYCVLPLALISKNITNNYPAYMDTINEFNKKMVQDTDYDFSLFFNTNFYDDKELIVKGLFPFEETIYEINNSNNPVDILLGSGYTYGQLPHDGHNEYKILGLELSNGDYLLVKAILWYNK